MSDPTTPTPEAAPTQNVFGINIIPAHDAKTPVSNKQLNVVADTMENAVGKVRAAYPGCDVRNVNKMCAIDLQ